MITVTIYQNRFGQYKGFHCLGHAQYAAYGTQETFEAETDQETGLIDIRFHQQIGHEAELLLKTMILGLQDIQDKYGKDYSFLTFKEV